MNGFSLLLALRYLRMAHSRSWRLYLIPLVALLLIGAIYGLDAFARHSQNPKILGLHVDYARLIGNLKWAGWLVFVLLATFVGVVRQLTIFTTISTYGMFLGCASLILVLGVMSGFEGDIKHKILGTHAQVEVTRVNEAFTDWREQLPVVKKVPGVVAVTPVLSSEAMISAPGNRANVVVYGIDPDTVGNVTALPSHIELGDLDSLAHPEKIKSLDDPSLDRDPDADLGVNSNKDTSKEVVHALPKRPADLPRRVPPGIILGRELARSLRVYIGDDVSMISPVGGIGPSGAVPKARSYRVAGIFYTGMFEYDSMFVYVTLPAAQKLFDQPGEVSTLDVKVANPDDTDAAVGAIGKALGTGYEATDWKALNGSLFSALALEKVVMFIILSFIILVAAFSIVANGHMIASQKVAEIAILKSMGATDATIAWAFVILGTMLGVFGVLAGVTGGLLGSFALIHWGYALDPDVFYMTQLPVKLEVHEILTVCGAGVAITVLATVYPAFMASRMMPVEGLREGGR